MATLPIKILFWTQQYRPYIGGVEVLSVRFIADMRALGYEFSVVTGHGNPDLPDEDEDDGVAVYRFRFQQALAARDGVEILQIRRRIAALKQKLQPDLIHFNLTDSSLFFHLQTNAAQIPTLMAVHLAVPTTVDNGRTLLGQALREANWITANSEAILSDLHQIAPDIAARSSVIYYGYALPGTKPCALPFDSPRVLCIGRIVPEKGFDLMLAAFPALLSRFPNLRLVIAGDGPARADLETQAAELGIADAVDFVGWIAPEKIPDLINEATIVVVPSRWREAFGLVALQASQMARPVVAARVGGLPEVVRDEETGLIVEPESPSALAAAVARLLENPDLAIRLGKQGRMRAQNQFGLQRYLESYRDLYARLLNR